MSVTGNWLGTVWGSNTAVLTAVLRESDGRITGELVFAEPGVGQYKANLAAAIVDANRFSGGLDSFTSQLDVTLPHTGTVAAFWNTAENTIEGDWQTDAGNSGKFALIKVRNQIAAAGSTPLAPLQASPAPTPTPPLVTKTLSLGSYRLDQEDLRRLVDIVRAGTNIAQPVLNATSDRKSFIHVGLDSLLADSNTPDVIYDLVISVNEPVAQRGTRSINVSFKKHAENLLFVSGYDRTWVEGKAAEIIQLLTGWESKTARLLRKYGPYVNSIIFLLLLAFLPSVRRIGQRLGIVALTVLLLFVLLQSWRTAVNSKIYVRAPKLSWYQRHANLGVTVAGAILSGLIAWLIAKYVHP